MRQGDKARDMRLFSFAAHLFVVHRLKRREPLLRTVWLSTEMQVRVEGGSVRCTWSIEALLRDKSRGDNLHAAMVVTHSVYQSSSRKERASLQVSNAQG